MPNESIASALDRLLRAQLPNIGDAVVIGQHEPLSSFRLDSLGIIRLALPVEQEFEVDFPDALMVLETFATAASVAVAVATLRPDLDIAS